MLQLISHHFTEFSVKWQLRNRIPKTVLFFKNKGIQKFVNTPIECKIIIPFILEFSRYWQLFFKKQIDFTDCTNLPFKIWPKNGLSEVSLAFYTCKARMLLQFVTTNITWLLSCWSKEKRETTQNATPF